MIKFDLHIHSSTSAYKEDKAIVDNSTTANAECLLKKLNENNVTLFSITDHNRFNVELYCKLDELLRTKKDSFPNVKGLVAGVEFDVQMDADMGKCHIITIFDAKNDIDNYKKIQGAINKQIITDKQAAYARENYEMLLKEIGMNVILIACQRSGLDRQSGHHNSLSESAHNPEELILTGYINALEFQKPNVEGILRNNLHDMPSQVGLVMGSDCHDWAEYPNHDKNCRNESFVHSRANILPTFKGLLMAVTSPESRINRQENRNPYFIKEMNINGSTIPLVNGLNVIIGENGAGKSTIIKMLDGLCKEKFVKDLISKNNMSFSPIGQSHIQYIGQGDIFKRFSDNSLFPNENYIEVDNTRFLDTYKRYAENIEKYVNTKIAAKKAVELLNNKSIGYDEVTINKNYFIGIKVDADYEKVDNPHLKQDSTFRKLLDSIIDLQDQPYYAEYIEELRKMVDAGEKIYSGIHIRNVEKKCESEIKNAIVSAYNEYSIKVQAAASSRENDKRDFEKKYQEFVDSIVKAILINSGDLQFPTAPLPINGASSNNKFGFRFNCEAKYNEKSVQSEFLEKVFTKEYASEDALKTIESVDKFKDAVRGCTETTQISAQYNKNVQAFLDVQTACKKFIVDGANENLGNTLGEMSLAYFNYVTQHDENCSVFLIDQPEDNISNNNISGKLLSYFNLIRYKKQIILVTHNPLLVVNQDAEQVVFVKKVNDKIDTVNGCLEREDAEVNMLDIIANNMDGGRSAIEKRLKVYGKEN